MNKLSRPHSTTEAEYGSVCGGGGRLNEKGVAFGLTVLLKHSEDAYVDVSPQVFTPLLSWGPMVLEVPRFTSNYLDFVLFYLYWSGSSFPEGLSYGTSVVRNLRSEMWGTC